MMANRGQMVHADILNAVYFTFAPDEAPRDGVVRFAEAIERLAPRKKRELTVFLRMLAAARFTEMAPAARERVLLTLARSPVPQLRTAFTAIKRLALFIAYSATDGEWNALWTRIGYPGPRPDRFEVPLQRLAIAPLDEIEGSYDAIVVGSGAGGGVAAAVLAQSGARVLVLEAGPAPESIVREQRELEAFAHLYLDSGTTATDDLSLAILAGSCVGGGTTVNWTTSLELEDPVADEWYDASGGIDFEESLSAHYAAVSKRMDLLPEVRHNANNDAIARGAVSLGWEAMAQPRNAQGCGDECGYCGFGCAYARKQGTLATFLHDAVSAGAVVCANARVERVIVEDAIASGVLVGGRTIHAKHVIVACGAIETPRLLARSGVHSPALGKHLHLHPAAAVIGEFEQPVESWRGPMQSVVCGEFSFIDDAYGFKLEAVPAHPGLGAMALPWRGREGHAALMHRIRHSASLIVLVRDRGHGSVGAGSIRYEINPYDAAHLRLGMRRLTELLFAAGAHTVRPLHQRALELHAGAAPRERNAFFETLARAPVGKNRMPVFSAHQMGTARMHIEPSRGVVDECGGVFGTANLTVADASVFPASSGVNPMLTVMALAHRTANAIVKE